MAATGAIHQPVAAAMSVVAHLILRQTLLAPSMWTTHYAMAASPLMLRDCLRACAVVAARVRALHFAELADLPMLIQVPRPHLLLAASVWARHQAVPTMFGMLLSVLPPELLPTAGMRADLGAVAALLRMPRNVCSRQPQAATWMRTGLNPGRASNSMQLAVPARHDLAADAGDGPSSAGIYVSLEVPQLHALLAASVGADTHLMLALCLMSIYRLSRARSAAAVAA